MVTINFPGGAGGNWLISILTSEPLPTGPVLNWHNHAKSKYENPFRLVHHLNDQYDILYSGTYYFNFYLNLLFKHYLVDANFQPTYQQRFDKMFEVARWLWDWHQIHSHKPADLSFDDLVTNRLTFYESMCRLQESHDLPCTKVNEFETRRNLFFETCVKSDDQFENFNSMTFVIFVLAWLERQGHYPHEHTHFIMNDPKNQHRCKKFVSEHYHLCPTIQHYVFDSGRECPDFLLHL